jgi:hypothetical protein
MPLDFLVFEKELYDASQEVFDAMIKDSRDEHLYSFALITTGLLVIFFHAPIQKKIYGLQPKNILLLQKVFTVN